ncbi:MAG: glycosyltransferase family 39 protein [Anaerolineae bacterium]|nr:glycosyltransferase family 39 protein [Anaerolineae bacterium]
MKSKRTWLTEPALIVVIVFTLIAMLVFDRPLVVGDGPAYLFWLDSITLDGDLNLDNQAIKFAAVNRYHIYLNQETGRWASAFPVGVALLLAPFYRVAVWLDALPAFRINDAHFIGLQGVPFAYSLCIMIGVNLYTLAMVGLAYGIARRFVRPWGAAISVLTVYLCTPMFYYTSVEPLTSHIAGGFAATLFVFLWLRAREGLIAREWKESLVWLWVGLAAGLTALCRWQVALIALPVGVELLWSRRWREVVMLIVGAALLAWIIPYSWWQMYGKLVLIPATEGDKSAFLMGPVNTLHVLFSPISGLFPWSPIVGLALFGFVPLARRDWRLALGALVMFVLQALVCGSVKNWWAGEGLGMRRMAELYPVYVLLLAALLGAASHYRWLSILLTTLAIALAAYGVALVLARMNFMWTNPERLARDLPWTELRYTFSKEHWRLMWPVMKDHVGPWAWRKPGP